MNRFSGIMLACGAAVLMVTAAHAGQAAQAKNSVFAARVGAKNVAALAKFYEAAFGLQELRRLQLNEGAEIMMQFGATKAAAKANKGTEVFINQRKSNAIKDPIAHLVLHVSDIHATAKAVTAAGGTWRMKPFKLGDSGIMIAIAVDPAGNLVEMIQTPKRPH